MECSRTAGMVMTSSAVHFLSAGDTPDGDFISLTEQQIEEYTRRFGEIEQFTGQEPELEPHMTILAF